MHLWQAVVLGIVEGITEFLPVSSTGHLTITEKLIGLPIDDPAVTAYTAIIQVGAISPRSSTSGATSCGSWWRSCAACLSAEARQQPGLAAVARGDHRLAARSRSSACSARTSSRVRCAACGWSRAG